MAAPGADNVAPTIGERNRQYTPSQSHKRYALVVFEYPCKHCPGMQSTVGEISWEARYV